ncbi:hypothetical protein ACFQQB_71835 [Nonomuraea rubra]
MFFAGGSVLSERLTQIQESLDRIERHLGIEREQPPGGKADAGQGEGEGRGEALG